VIVFHTHRIRSALSRPAAWGTDLLLLLLVGSVIGGMFMIARQVAAPFDEKVIINLSFRSLPKYAILSLGRVYIAYLLSLLFTLSFGTLAAHHARAEKLMLPLLDVLQAIPVLGFLPGLVLAMIALFPRRELGLELACIIMIFTAQAWNMTFSFHGSLCSIPPPLREVAIVQKLSPWKTFRLLEMPSAMIGLVWNSMMSMAGGWFFLTVNEAFTLGNHDYRLPGIGSYMNEAINRGNTPAMLAAIAAMIIMIVAVDQLFWRPIVVWSQRFKLEEIAATDKPQSWLLNLMQSSHVHDWLHKLVGKRAGRSSFAVEARPLSEQSRSLAVAKVFNMLRPALKWMLIVTLVVLGCWGSWSLLHLLAALPIIASGEKYDWLHVFLALIASFARTTAAVLLGAAWALPAGILIGLSPRWSRRLQPLVQVAASFPAPMLFPLVTMLLLLLHVPFTLGCISLMLLGAQWYILFNVIAGATAIPSDLKDVAQIFNISRRDRWIRLYIPCVFPYLLTGLVTAAGGAWNATIVSEYVQVEGRTYAAFGLGSTISHATAAGHFPLLAAAVTAMALFVVLLNRLFWKRLYRLAESRYSLNT